MPDTERAADLGGGRGLVPNAVRPQGLQVWNADAMATDLSVDFGDPAEPLRPVMIMGAKNGSFTGKVVVGSTLPIQELKVTPGELKGQEGSIPAATCRCGTGCHGGRTGR